MSISIRRSKERGYENNDWLQTYHTFSFGEYYDSKFMGYSSLRVINEDRVQPGKGFGAHPHKDMEIITYVLSGALEHQDSLGNKGVIQASEVQKMSAGTGVVHSEHNFSQHEEVCFFQIWIYPEHFGIAPAYEQKVFSSAAKWGQWCLIASNNTRNGSLKIHQDADIYASILDQDGRLHFEALPNRHYWIQIISGKFVVQNHLLNAGDGAALTEETSIDISCKEGGEFLFFDLV